MFGLGFGEIIVILVVALLVFGPDKLPEVARTLGKTAAELRRAMDDLKHEFHAPRFDLDHELKKPDPVVPSAAPPAQQLPAAAEPQQIQAPEQVPATPPEPPKDQ